MAENEIKQSTFKRLTNRYRLIIMNDHTYEEVVTFKLTRLSVYVLSCFVFVLLVGLTTALISFTPLKFYIPNRELYWENVRNIISGKAELNLDTAVISIPNLEQTPE